MQGFAVGGNQRGIGQAVLRGHGRRFAPEYAEGEKSITVRDYQCRRRANVEGGSAHSGSFLLSSCVT